MENVRLTMADSLRRVWIWFLNSKSAAFVRGFIFASVAIWYACMQMSATFTPAVPEKPFTYEIYLPQNYAMILRWTPGALAATEVSLNTYKAKEKEYQFHYVMINNAEIWYYAKNENSTHVEYATRHIKNPDANGWTVYSLKDIKFDPDTGTISAQGSYLYRFSTVILYCLGAIGAALCGFAINFPVTKLCRKIYGSYFWGK